jgi:ribosomal protein L14
MTCAELNHLVYLPRGDAAVTRRAKKASSLSAVVVRFSRSRRRYERQGILVEQAALDAAAQSRSPDAAGR